MYPPRGYIYVSCTGYIRNFKKNVKNLMKSCDYIGFCFFFFNLLLEGEDWEIK